MLAAHKGLHARPLSENIKAEITVFELGQGGTGYDTSVIRKAMIYHECVPMSLNDENLDYEGRKLIQRQVEWVYNHCTVRDMSQLEFLNNNTEEYQVNEYSSKQSNYEYGSGDLSNPSK